MILSKSSVEAVRFALAAAIKSRCIKIGTPNGVQKVYVTPTFGGFIAGGTQYAFDEALNEGVAYLLERGVEENDSARVWVALTAIGQYVRKASRRNVKRKGMPEDTVAKVTTDKDVRKVVNACRDQADQIVICGLARGWTYEKIAEDLGMSKQAVAKRIEGIRERAKGE